MTGVIKRILTASSKKDDLDEYNVEYSFAMEYDGPPISYDIPHVVPVDVDRIPTAAAVVKASLLNNLSVPVVQPIERKGQSMAEMSKELKLRSDVSNSVMSMEDLREIGVSSDLYGVGNEGAFDLENGNRGESRLSDGNGSSGTLGFSDSRDHSNEISGSSDGEDLIDGEEKAMRLEEYISPAEPNLETLGMSSSEVSSVNVVEHFRDEAAREGNSTHVTFRDLHSDDKSSEESNYDGTEDIPERPIARSDGKKGACYRCLKGNRFAEKEVCIVCVAKYCRNCVLRAMGSMPEGRKCITCIGFRINESRRRSLGRCSRMLKRMLTDFEIEKIMNAEVSCKVNQLPPHFIFVNGKSLSLDDLLKLQSCENPPKKLKPGNYWYDKVSGFWGKEGEKPCQIISPQLTVGDQLRRNASNGNTNVLVNGRAITKPELWMLQFAGIHCEGSPSYWLSADGSYQEEGMNNVIGKIWDKTGIRLFCVALSLPVPPESENREMVDGDLNRSKLNNLDKIMQYKLLLVGSDQSGTSTIFKQAKILYKVPFSDEERQSVKFIIQRDLYRYLAILLEGREKFEEEYVKAMRQHSEQTDPSGMPDQIDEGNIYSINPRLKSFSDLLLQVTMSGNLEAVFPANTREYSPLIELLWKDGAFQATYGRRNELQSLPWVANYFLDRAVEISKADYDPSDMDILYAEGISSSNGVTSMEFSLTKSSQEDYLEPENQDESLRRCQLIRVNARSLGENCKWLEMFEDVEFVLFCVSLTDYDEFYEDCNGVCTNKMLESRRLFESIVSHPTSAQKNFLLILNKFDLLEEKIEKVPLTLCDWFDDFNPVISHHPNRTSNSNPPLAQRAFHYIAVKFKRLFKSLTGRKLYVVPATGLEADSVDEALRYGMEILKWEEERRTCSVTEWSSESNEASTTS